MVLNQSVDAMSGLLHGPLEHPRYDVDADALAADLLSQGTTSQDEIDAHAAEQALSKVQLYESQIRRLKRKLEGRSFDATTPKKAAPNTNRSGKPQSATKAHDKVVEGAATGGVETQAAKDNVIDIRPTTTINNAGGAVKDYAIKVHQPKG